jgi:hypothetical protein
MAGEQPGNAMRSASIYVRWRKEGRFRTEEHFAELRSKWISLKAENRIGKAREANQQIIDLDIAALPCLIGLVGQRPKVIPAIAKLTGVTFSPTTTVADCRQWLRKNRQ